MVSNRNEVQEFIKRINEADAVYLSKLAEGGIHLHTLLADDVEHIKNAEECITKSGYPRRLTVISAVSSAFEEFWRTII